MKSRGAREEKSRSSGQPPPELQHALQQSEAKYRAVFDASREALLIADGQTGMLIDANAAALVLLDRSMEEVCRLHQRDIHALDDVLAGTKAFRRYRRESGATEHVVLRPDGTRIFVEISASPMQDAQGRDLVLGVFHDLTERKRYEAELILAREGAEAANRAKSVFLATMSHELRTPLNAILGFAEILEVEMSDRGLGESLTDIRKIRRAGSHLLDLISEVIDLSKIEAGRMELHPTMFDMKVLLPEVLASVGALAAKNSVEIRMSCDEAQVYADRLRVRQCVFNLVGNACKFSHDGEVIVTGTCQNGPDGDWYNVRVADTGIGIKAEDLGKLFSEFTQIDALTNRKYGGSGLGLAISRKLSRLMGGDISVESELGLGSAFTFRFPCSGPASAER